VYPEYELQIEKLQEEKKQHAGQEKKSLLAACSKDSHAIYYEISSIIVMILHQVQFQFFL
jgi:hypothetical protein